MSLIIYTPDFSGRNEIVNVISVQMSYYYNNIGKLILDVPIASHNVEVLKKHSILYDTEKKLAYIIKNVKIDTKQSRITANGYTTNTLLNKRIIAAPAAVSNVESDIYSVVNDNLRGLNKIATAPPKGLAERSRVTLYGGEVLEQIIPVLSNAGLGNRMTWDHRTEQHIFEVYKGQDRTTGIDAVTFSDEQGTARDLVITDDASTFKNVVYVVSTYFEEQTNTDGKTITVERQLLEVVGTATGDERHEQWLDVSLNTEEGETEGEFRERMRNHGRMQIGKNIKPLSFSVVIDPAELGTVYNIGDIVACVSKRFGVRFNARVSGVKYKQDINSKTTEIILGEPIIAGGNDSG